MPTHSYLLLDGLVYHSARTRSPRPGLFLSNAMLTAGYNECNDSANEGKVTMTTVTIDDGLMEYFRAVVGPEEDVNAFTSEALRARDSAAVSIAVISIAAAILIPCCPSV